VFIGILLFLFKKYLYEIMWLFVLLFIFWIQFVFLLNTYHVAKTEIFKNKGVGFFNILNKVTDLEEVK